jgi:uncharacterized membrane protein YphA (DoxX/SURF4 family)
LTLIAQCVVFLRSTDVGFAAFLSVALTLAAAACLLIGFMTPLIAVALGLGALILAIFPLPLPAHFLFDTPHTIIYLIVLPAVIALLGPGALSVDARMFGRREIRIPSASVSSSNRQQ